MVRARAARPRDDRRARSRTAPLRAEGSAARVHAHGLGRGRVFAFAFAFGRAGLDGRQLLGPAGFAHVAEDAVTERRFGFGGRR